jgi:23S rRNA pseudouridine2605 synthase
MHPSSEVSREYLVRLRGHPTAEVLDQLRRGVEIEDGPANFDEIAVESSDGSHSWVRVQLHEGRNREVRRLFEHQGFEVSRLSRLRYGSVKLPRDLRGGAFIALDDAAIAELSSMAARASPSAAQPVPK